MSLWSYIKGDRYGKDAHHLEQEAMHDPFLQDAIDGYFLDNDHPVHHLKKLKKQITKRTRKTFHNLQLWGIAALVLLIICLTVFFFLKDKGIVLDEKAYLENRRDSLFISEYKQHTEDSLAKVQSQQAARNTVVADKKDDVTSKPMELPLEKNKPAGQQEEKKKSEEIRYKAVNQELEEDGNYTLSNSETQAILSKNNQEVDKKEIPDNLNQTSKPTIGAKAYNDYIEKNRHQLTDDDCRKQHGKVILLFNVNDQGRPVDIAVLRSLCPAADREAVRLLQNGPGWPAGDNSTRLEIDF